MQTRLIAACMIVSVLVAFAGGVLFERNVGTDALIDGTGLRLGWEFLARAFAAPA